MQPGCGRGDGSGPIGVSRLIPGCIAGVMPVDVRGKGNFATLAEQALNRFSVLAVRRELNNATATVGITLQYLELDFRAFNRELITRPHAFGWSGQTQPAPFSTGIQHQKLGQTSPRSTHLQARLQHPRVIDHEKITGVQFVQKIPNLSMTGGWAGLAYRRNHQHASRMAWLYGGLGDAVLRQQIVVTAKQLISDVRHPAQSARLSGRVSISSARSLRKAAPSAP